MPNLKELVVKDSSLYEHGCLLPLTSVISACPCLQEFMFEVGAFSKYIVYSKFGQILVYHAKFLVNLLF